MEFMNKAELRFLTKNDYAPHSDISTTVTVVVMDIGEQPYDMALP